MISEKVKKLVDNMSMADLKLWIYSSFGNIASQKGKEIKEFMIKKYYEKYGNL